MGAGLVYHLGQLEYVDSSPTSTSLNTSLLAYLAGGVGGAILVVVFIVIVLFMRKSRQSARAVRRMRYQMDILEARVAKECKEGWEIPVDLRFSFILLFITLLFVYYVAICFCVTIVKKFYLHDLSFWHFVN